MIKNPKAYARQSEQERWETLRRMSVQDSIAIGEALLTSDLMRLTDFPDDDCGCRCVPLSAPVGYVALMKCAAKLPLDPRRRWAIFEERYGDLARASDVAWAASLTPGARLAVVEGLLASVRNVREQAGDWDEVEARSWQAALEERLVQVAAFRRLDEVNCGRGS